MAKEEEQHACILHACRAIIENYDDESLDPSISREKAQALNARLNSFLTEGTRSLAIEEAFRRLGRRKLGDRCDLQQASKAGGPRIVKTMENLSVSTSVQRQKLKAALRQFCTNPALLSSADAL